MKTFSIKALCLVTIFALQPAFANETGSSPEPKPLTAAEMGYKFFMKMVIFFKPESLFTLDYKEGYNLNFQVTEQELEALLPEGFTPLKLKLLESDAEPLFYISWYLAGLGGEGGPTTIDRMDVFTYVIDPDGQMGLYFLSGVMEMPSIIKTFGFTRGAYKSLLEFLARDSLTGEPAYPHFYADTFISTRDHMLIEYEDSFIELRDCSAITTGERFTLDFINANSQIYRTAIDKNVNYFNQTFINAPVELRDQSCINSQNIELFHPLLRMQNLRSVHFYGSEDKVIRWYFEM